MKSSFRMEPEVAVVRERQFADHVERDAAHAPVLAQAAVIDRDDQLAEWRAGIIERVPVEHLAQCGRRDLEARGVEVEHERVLVVEIRRVLGSRAAERPPGIVNGQHRGRIHVERHVPHLRLHEALRRALPRAGRSRGGG